MDRLRKKFAQGLLFAAVALCIVNPARAGQELPKGLMLNLDFQSITNGLIPSKALYPLHVPQGKLKVKNLNGRSFLLFDKGQGLDIPHSSLLDPDGSAWMISIRVLAATDGIILSQGNAESGYVIYLQEGIVHATILSGVTSVTLREKTGYGAGNILNKSVTIDLKIWPDSALLILNRNRASLVSLQHPLSGENQWIRIGEQHSVPAPLKHKPSAGTAGFKGGISTLKILRQ